MGACSLNLIANIFLAQQVGHAYISEAPPKKSRVVGSTPHLKKISPEVAGVLDGAVNLLICRVYFYYDLRNIAGYVTKIKV